MRHKPPRRLVLAGLMAMLAAAGPAAARIKRVSKAMAMYRPTPKGPQSCLTCSYFRNPDRCKAVFGKVSPKGWCMLFDMAD